MVQQLENDLKGALDFEAVTQQENEYLMSVLRQNGIDPWELPSDKEE